MIRRMEEGEEERVCTLVRAVFQQFVAPLYPQEGVDEFLRYADPVALAERTGHGHFTLVAEEAGSLVGILEMRNLEHISLLFVDGMMQRRGIARRLLSRGLEIARVAKPDLAKVTVNSSPNAVAAYQALGFEADGPEGLDHGIRFVPMRLTLQTGAN